MSRVSPPSGESVEAPRRVHLTPKQRLELLLAYKGRCAICGEKINDAEWDANHKTPLFQLRDGDPQEFEPVHKACHRTLTDGTHARDNAKLRRVKRKFETLRSEWPKTQKIRSRGFSRRWSTVEDG